MARAQIFETARCVHNGASRGAAVPLNQVLKQLAIADRIAEVKQREIRATLADKATNRRLELPQVWKAHSCSRNHRYGRTVHIFESKGSLHTCKAN